MNNDKILNETGKKVFEELKKHSKGLDKNKNTQSYASALTDEESHVLHQNETLQRNFNKVLGQLRSENIKFDIEVIERKKDD
ncbi:hypothetical protein [Psychrobacillus sp. FSL H8-0510]|uniref:hypothetical protein n=1 Tax=Psychrobacillus sp. FSL H8-0510 TaxID=2921394 RepID=UPI0030F4BB7C